MGSESASEGGGGMEGCELDMFVQVSEDVTCTTNITDPWRFNPINLALVFMPCADA